MNNKHYDIIWTNQFKKDYKLAMKRNLNIDLLDDIIRKLANWQAANNFRRKTKITL